MLEEKKGLVIWLDAGCELVDNLGRFRASVLQHGMHSPRSPGSIQKWTHPAMLNHFEVSDPQELDYRQISAGIGGYNYAHAGVREMIFSWLECAMVKSCISPVGSSRSNHRQDQSILSILAYRFGHTESIDIRDVGYNKMLLHQRGKVLSKQPDDAESCLM